MANRIKLLEMIQNVHSDKRAFRVGRAPPLISCPARLGSSKTILLYQSGALASHKIQFVIEAYKASSLLINNKNIFYEQYHLTY